MGHSIPVSHSKNISTMKFLLGIFVVLTIVLAVSGAQLNYFYKSRAAVNGALGFPRAYGGSFGYNGYRGYSGFRGYGGYGGYGYSGFRGKRSADSEPEDEYMKAPILMLLSLHFMNTPKWPKLMDILMVDISPMAMDTLDTAPLVDSLDITINEIFLK